MSIPYEATGRTHQKARTRNALLDAVRDLLRQGVSPTVEQAAQTAGISRTTAYRYFPNQRSLLASAHPEIESTSLLGEDPPDDAEARLEIVLEELARQIKENAVELRTALRLSLEPDVEHRQLLLRQGRAIGWLEEALQPLRGTLPDRDLYRLVLGIRACFGIEALVWLTDVAGLPVDEALDVMHHSAKAVFRSATARGSGGGERARRSQRSRRMRYARGRADP